MIAPAKNMMKKVIEILNLVDWWYVSFIIRKMIKFKFINNNKTNILSMIIFSLINKKILDYFSYQ